MRRGVVAAAGNAQGESAGPDQPPSAPVRRVRFALLDGVRFLAAVMVVSYHFTAFGQGAWGARASSVFPQSAELTKYGAYGAQLFFVISGFVILLTAWGKRREDFVASRIARLFPAYWVSVALTAVLSLVIWKGRTSVTWNDAITNLTMVQTAFGAPHVDGVYWTLWVELRFYVLVLVLMSIGLTRKRLLVVVAAWPVLAALSAGSESLLLETLLMPEAAPFFAGGIAISMIHKFGHDVLTWLLLGANVIFAMRSHLPFLRAIERGTGLPTSSTVAHLVVASFFLIVALVVLTPLVRVQWKALTTLGMLTYPLYLIHEFWGWYIISRVREHADEYVALAAAVGVTAFVAWLIMRFVETPLAPGLRRAVLRSLAQDDDGRPVGRKFATTSQDGSGTP